MPLHGHTLQHEREGERCNVIEVVPVGDGHCLMTNMSKTLEKSRADFIPRPERLGLDFGLSTLIATDRGDLMGRSFLDAMRRPDLEISGTRQAPHCGPVADRATAGAIANWSCQDAHRFAHSTGWWISRDARNRGRATRGMPELSRRLDRINCGRAVFKAKLADMGEQFGIKVAGINPG
jgi:putative transposase